MDQEGIALPALICCCLLSMAASSGWASPSELCLNTTGALDIVPELSDAGSRRFAYSESPPPLAGGDCEAISARQKQNVSVCLLSHATKQVFKTREDGQRQERVRSVLACLLLLQRHVLLFLYRSIYLLPVCSTHRHLMDVSLQASERLFTFK